MMNHIHIAGNMGIKCEPLEDPYSFVDDDPTPIPQPRPPAVVLQNMPKKQGRKKKIPEGQHSTLANYATEAGKKALHTKEKCRRPIGRPRIRWTGQAQGMEAKGADWRRVAGGEVWRDRQEQERMCHTIRRGGNFE
uniref:Uncharacterized protein n=1 Tax=Timema douglasi TaxID=61478 RepID=A0A7R8VII4_TIMDO|nr:unnamed protein product [Timema douglasi]